MPPDPRSPFDPEDIPCFSGTWCSLSWSPWVPFNAGRHTFQSIPHEPGLYRIRPAGKDFLMYIGETGRPLHTRLNDLRQNLRRSDLMPWSDPHSEAPALWSWWVAWASASPGAVLPDPSRETEDPPGGTGAVMLECSAAPLDASAGSRKGMAAFLLYTYRQERRESPLCNFGRFHPRYRKSTIRREGLRGGRLAGDQEDNPAGGPGAEPLEGTGRPGDSNWMGLAWTPWEMLTEENARDVSAGAGLYLLKDAGSHEIVYIGRSADIAKRLPGHCQKSGDDRPLAFSYRIVGQAVLPHNLSELANDLVGNYFGHFRKVPAFQFRNRS